MKIAIVGLGLIGGSLARTIRLHTDYEVYGCDISRETIEQAKLVDAINGELTNDILRECDLTLVALYPAAIITWITEHADLFKPGSVVIDCGGVKQYICNALSDVVRGRSWHFIGGHPMGGREFSGFRYTRDDMFDKSSMILCPDHDESLPLMQEVRGFFLDIGFRRVQFTTPAIHDEMIAYTSQLAHIVSNAYVKCPRAEKHRGFSAGSFADMTRVARMNENMWTELFFENRDALLLEVDELIVRLCQYRDALRDQDIEGMRALLHDGSETKKRLSE